MMAKWMLTLKNPVNWMEERHPLLSMILWQFASALFLILAVGGTALAGGAVIWTFYKMTGVM